MANVGTQVTGTAEADLRVQVRAVHVNLSAVLMDDLANLLDSFLEDAVGRGVGDHERGEVVAMSSGLLAEIGQIHVAIGVAANRQDAQAGHDGTGGIGGMGRIWNQVDIEGGLSATGVAGAQDHEGGGSGLGASVGVSGDSS